MIDCSICACAFCPLQPCVECRKEREKCIDTKARLLAFKQAKAKKKITAVCGEGEAK